MKKKSISQKQLREFGYIIGIGIPVIFGYLIPLISGHLFRLWSLLIGIPVFILGVLKPSLLFYPYKFWMKIGYILGWVNSRIILGLIFVAVLCPIAVIMTFFNYDPLKLKKQNLKTFREFKKNHKIDLKRIF